MLVVAVAVALPTTPLLLALLKLLSLLLTLRRRRFGAVAFSASSTGDLFAATGSPSLVVALVVVAGVVGVDSGVVVVSSRNSTTELKLTRFFFVASGVANDVDARFIQI